jgi:cellobiose phosphorylase
MKKVTSSNIERSTYYPILNQKGLKGSLNPFFAGDLTLGHHHFVLEPTSELHLYKGLTPRNVLFFVDGIRYDLNGIQPHQHSDDITYETDSSYQIVIRSNEKFTLHTTSFIPLDHNVEIHDIQFTNTDKQPLQVKVHTMVMMYGRSAEQLRDHRHVTSLLNQMTIKDEYMVIQPTLTFDEKGHHLNNTLYGVGVHSRDLKIEGIVPILDDVIGSGSLEFPHGLKNYTHDTYVEGYEACGAFGFETITLLPGQSLELKLWIGAFKQLSEIDKALKVIEHEHALKQALEESTLFYHRYEQKLQFSMIDKKVSTRLNETVMQPLYRRDFGNSFLPHHDYGKGGRGWRDLWQDLIALIMNDDEGVKQTLINNFKGVRLDGSNATIIGSDKGTFIADRNQIKRVWSDHGAWPLITLNMYIHETGDLSILNEVQSYFYDGLSHYGEQATQVIKEPSYQGTILEHLLIQHLVAIHHTGQHGYIKLLDADWNDGLDMGKERAETIAFTMMYVHHLSLLVDLIRALNVEEVSLMGPLVSLLKRDIDLKTYFEQVAHHQFKQEDIASKVLIDALNELYESKKQDLQQRAFQHQVFQSYIDHTGVYLDNEATVMLTGQAMALLNKIASSKQARELHQKTTEKLFQKELGGYQLNSRYDKEKHGLGRAFYFAYGHKENGAVFSHMAMMYAYGLYEYDMTKEGRQAWLSVVLKAMDHNALVYRGIPEYFNNRGHGKYMYLTGSASWLLYILRRQVFGIKFEYGQLYLAPQLVLEDFIEMKASIHTMLFHRASTVTYQIKKQEEGPYDIDFMQADGKIIQLPIVTHYKEITVYLKKRGI